MGAADGWADGARVGTAVGVDVGGSVQLLHVAGHVCATMARLHPREAEMVMHVASSTMPWHIGRVGLCVGACVGMTVGGDVGWVVVGALDGLVGAVVHAIQDAGHASFIVLAEHPNRIASP